MAIEALLLTVVYFMNAVVETCKILLVRGDSATLVGLHSKLNFSIPLLENYLFFIILIMLGSISEALVVRVVCFVFFSLACIILRYKQKKLRNKWFKGHF